MAEHSKIEWTDATWNPMRGCTKISPGCAHCYAEGSRRDFGASRDTRMSRDHSTFDFSGEARCRLKMETPREYLSIR